MAGAALLLALATPAWTRPQFRIEEKGGGLGNLLDQSILLSIQPAGGRHGALWRADRDRSESAWCGARTDKGCIVTQSRVRDRIEGQDCPALERMMAALPAARAADRRSRPDVVVTDSAEVRLIAFSGTGTIEQTQPETVGPIADWWHAGAAAIADCWVAVRSR